MSYFLHCVHSVRLLNAVSGSLFSGTGGAARTGREFVGRQAPLDRLVREGGQAGLGGVRFARLSA